jgi:hypothetical protein
LIRPFQVTSQSSARCGRRAASRAKAIEASSRAVTGRDVLKTAPRGYPADHRRVELLRYKGLVAWKEWGAQPWLSTPEAKDKVEAFLVPRQPLAGWLTNRVGPSAQPDSRRR